jgi:DNA-binding transcriptional MerR regulator
MLPQTKLKKNNTASTKRELPPIPDKIYFTIGEISELCALEAHVLRYWEQEFSQLKPSRRRGNRRYYQRKEVLLVRQIRSLLYEQGFTIEGAKMQLSNNTRSTVTNNKDNDVNNVKLLLNKIASNIEQIMVDLNKESI